METWATERRKRIVAVVQRGDRPMLTIAELSAYARTQCHAERVLCFERGARG